MKNASTLTVRGLVPDMPLKFNVDEFYFTSPSEHTLEGQAYDLEMQIVHSMNTDYLPDETKLKSRKLVLSVLFQVKAGANNTFLGSLNIPTLDFIPTLPIADFLSSISKLYIYYDGSMSRPPCTENVYRFVMFDAQSMSADQLKYFTNHYSGNARGVQKLNGRPVLRVSKTTS
ncbi:MAG: carbonic anhydrase family protein [Candidatus Pacebacteria bacterium]|nr:carbonic anhydrase family protein [Candidatus Paceibacterota bacterium]